MEDSGSVLDHKNYLNEDSSPGERLSSPIGALDRTDQDATPSSLPRLLQLPIEIFQLIQLHMDVSTFFISLLTCKHFHKAATSTALLVSHLETLPGIRLGFEDFNVKDLRSLFQRRAADSGQAAGVLADVCRFDGGTHCMMSKSTALSRNEQVPRNSHYVVMAVPFRDGTIQLFEVTNRLVRKRELLEIHQDDDYRGEILFQKLAFAPGSRDLAVLCTQGQYDPDKGVYRGGHGPIWDRKGKYITHKLVVFHRLHARQKGWFYSSSVQDTRDIVFSRGAKVVDLALSPTGLACIAWIYQDLACENWPAREPLVWLVHRNNELMDACPYDPCPRLSPVIYTNHAMHGLVCGVGFRDEGRTLDLFASGRPIPCGRVGIQDGEHPIFSLTATQNQADFDRDGTNYKFHKGPVFYSKHTSNARFDSEEEPLCKWSDLTIAIAIHEDEALYSTPPVFVTLNETYRDPSLCDHRVNIGRARFMDKVKPVALLAGFQSCQSSLGTVMAASSGGYRIAAAMWNCIYIWSFDAKLLSDADLSTYFPRQDYNAAKGFGRIRPTQLSSSAGVVHSMFWIGDDILFTITDRGLSRFDVSPLCEGHHEDMSLIWDTWTTTALSEPAPGSGQDYVPATVQHDALFSSDDEG